MTDIELLNNLRNIVGTDDDDEVLFTYLNIAGSEIIARAYPYAPANKTVPVQYEYLQIQIAAYLMNKRGAEGQTAHSENGINRTYESANIPESMLKMVVPYCGVIK